MECTKFSARFFRYYFALVTFAYLFLCFFGMMPTDWWSAHKAQFTIIMFTSDYKFLWLHFFIFFVYDFAKIKFYM